MPAIMPAVKFPIPNSRSSRWPRTLKPFNPGPFDPKDLSLQKELVNRFLSLDPSYISSPLVKHLNAQLQPTQRIISPPRALSLPTAIGTLSSSDLKGAHRKLVYDLGYALARIKRFEWNKSRALVLPTSEKMGPRSQFLLWCAVLSLIGIYIGVPFLNHVTIGLRPGEDYDIVRTSIREKFEERSLLPFLHTAVYVPSDGIVRPHLHMLILARHFDWVEYHREWRVLCAFAFERHKRSGFPTSVHFTPVTDLTGLIRLRPRYDPALGRSDRPTGYLCGDANLTRPGAKAIASQIIRTLSNNLLGGGYGDVLDIDRHLKRITYSAHRSYWVSRGTRRAGP